MIYIYIYDIYIYILFDKYMFDDSGIFHERLLYIVLSFWGKYCSIVYILCIIINHCVLGCVFRNTHVYVVIQPSKMG